MGVGGGGLVGLWPLCVDSGPSPLPFSSSTWTPYPTTGAPGAVSIFRRSTPMGPTGEDSAVFWPAWVGKKVRFWGDP